MKNNRLIGDELLKKFKIIVAVLCIFLIIFAMFWFRKPILKKIYVVKYDEYVSKYSNQYDIDKYLILAIIKAESNFNENAVSKKGAKGLMQLMDTTAEDLAKNSDINLDDIFEPDINIQLGSKYISALMSKYDSIGLALAAYNAGSGNVDNWIKDGILKKDGSDIEKIPFIETNNYVRKILRDYELYKELYN